MIKVLYLATRFPWPVKAGRERMINQIIRYLHSSYEVYFAFFCNDILFNWASSLPVEFEGLRLVPLPLPTRREILKNFLFRKKSYALQEHLFYSIRAKQILEKTIEEIKPDIIIADMIRTAQYIEDWDGLKILDMDDLLSIRYERMLKYLQYQVGSLLGTFENKLHLPVRENILRPFIRKILTLESRRIRERENILTHKFDHVLLVSPMEVNILRQRVNLSNISWFPPSVRAKYIYNPTKKNVFLYLGNLHTPQNRASIKFIVDYVFPLLKEERINFEFWIVGDYPSNFRNLFKDKHIKFLGFVRNLEEIMAKVKILLSPISFGTGIKTKILDAMAYGVPVFTNSVGAEGLMVKKDFHCIVEDNPRLLVSKLISVLKDPNLLLSLSKNGFEYVRRYHDDFRLNKKLKALINDLFN
jgi:glycosyltransferase involved in cell wall biosynthesis